MYIPFVTGCSSALCWPMFVTPHWAQPDGLVEVKRFRSKIQEQLRQDELSQYFWQNGGVFFLTDTASKYKTKLYVSNSDMLIKQVTPEAFIIHTC